MIQSVINTFDKGLHQDSTFVLQPDGTYRNLKNGMLISHDGNHYSIELSKGNKTIFSLPARYHSNVSNYTDKDVPPMPIGFISFMDKLVVFMTNNQSTTGGYGEIGVISFTRVGDDFTSSYLHYYHHPSLLFTKYHKIEGFSFRENDQIERVYWTDNFNEPRVFDIANPIFTTYLTGVADLIVGKQYMVLSGVVSHNSIYYGPSDDSNPALQAIPYVNSNIFTAVGTSFTPIVTSVVIEYFPMELLAWTSSRLLGDIQFDSYGTGSVNCGAKTYFYRLSNSANGNVTSWSYPSSPMQVETTNIYSAEVPQGNNYHNISGDGTSTTIVSSNKSVFVRIYDVDTNFDTIELAAAEYDQVDDVPYKISIVNKVAITSSDMTVEHVGNLNLGTVTLADLTLFPASILRCKTITTNKNYNIIANITEREEFEISFPNLVIDSFEYPMIAHGDLDVCNNKLTYDPHSPLLASNPTATSILPWSRYLVTHGEATVNTVTYNAVVYLTGQVITGIVGQTTITFAGTGAARPCVTRNRYTPFGTSERRENAIEIKTGFWDYKDPAVAHHCKGYWSAEKYRIGILFYDLKGNPFYVRYLDDFTFPPISDKSGTIRSDAYVVGSETEIYSLNPSGLKISGVEIPADVIDKISGFSIVRAERDARIVTQGLAMALTLSGITYRPQATIIVGASAASESNDTYVTYMCPDYLDGNPMRKAFGADGDALEEACWIDAYDFGGGAYIAADKQDNNTVAKLFVPLTHDTANSIYRFNRINTNKGEYVRPFSENVVEADFNGIGNTFENKTTTGATVLTDETCSGGGAGNIGGLSAVGCKKIIISLDNVFRSYGSANVYTSTGATRPKIMMNFVKDIDPADQYGGVSDVAIANTLYQTTGHFQPINALVKSETFDGADKYVFNDIEVFGGDCFLNIIDETYALCDTGVGTSYSFTIYYPCECNSNYNLRRGRVPSRQGTSTALTTGAGQYLNGITYNDGVSIRLEDYQYNSGYSSEGSFLKYPSLPLNYKFTGKFEYRTRWAGPKFPGELIDSFRIFPVNDYRDLDGQRGEINNLKVRDSKLFYWQNHGVGYLPILERQLVGGSALGDATALGVGGVIDRFDDIDTYFGNQHQHGLTESEYGFFWFDMRRRALCIMQTGGQIKEISLVNGLQVFFNSEFNEGNVFYPNSFSAIYNTNNSDIPEVPLLGYGIVGVYDPKFKMSYLTFKYNKYDLLDVEDEIVTVNAKDFTIGYCHVLDAIVGFYDFTPAIWHNHNDLVLSSNNSKNRVYYGSNMPATIFNVDDTVSITGNATPSKDGEYVCLKTTPSSTYPLTGIYEPTYVGSIYWVKTNDQSQIYLQTFNTEYLKFYGQVYNNEIEIVVNPKSKEAFSVQNIRIKGNSVNFTDVTVTTDDQTASDTNISLVSRFYRYINKTWNSSLPLPSNGKVVDYYTKIKLTYKGYLTNPTTSKNVNKFYTFMESFFKIKR